MKRATCRKEGTEWAVKCIDKAKLDKEDEEALKVRSPSPPLASSWSTLLCGTELIYSNAAAGAACLLFVRFQPEVCVRFGAPLGDVQTEVAILEQVDHTNIVRLRQVFDCPKVFYMVMECMTGGELFDRIVEKSKYSEAEAAVVVRKIVSALVYCHARGIVHRDLKPENLLYTDKTDAAEIKIADFGWVRVTL